MIKIEIQKEIQRIYVKIGDSKTRCFYPWRYYYRTLESIKNAYLRTFWKPIYYTCWSRDCDMCESTSSGVVLGGEKAWDKMMDRTAEWAEGPVSYDRISKEEYEEFIAPPVRDRIMEAYENGNGTSIYV